MCQQIRHAFIFCTFLGCIFTSFLFFDFFFFGLAFQVFSVKRFLPLICASARRFGAIILFGKRFTSLLPLHRAKKNEERRAPRTLDSNIRSLGGIGIGLGISFSFSVFFGVVKEIEETLSSVGGRGC